MPAPCIWYRSWRDEDPPLNTDECALWDAYREKCERNEDCPTKGKKQEEKKP